MEVNFVKLSPTQNMTLLITSPVDRKDHAECASQLMRYESVHAEQTGFVEKPRNEKAAARLQMAGGEFCGNAAMALAALIARDKKLMRNGTHSLLLEVSGHSALVECLITPKDGYFIGKVRIPSPQFAESKEITVGDGVLSAQMVHFSGITHMIITESLPEARKRALINGVTQQYKDYTKEDALGILFLNKAAMEMEPFVYVPSAQSRVWERGCGTGSAAVGYALTLQEGRSLSLDLQQPGGIISVSSVFADGEVSEIWIEGRIDMVAEGRAYCALPTVTDEKAEREALLAGVAAWINERIKP